jgi:hypothetical protein
MAKGTGEQTRCLKCADITHQVCEGRSQPQSDSMHNISGDL